MLNDDDRMARMHNTLAVVLAGGKGSRLEPLTRDRAKPAVPFRRRLPDRRFRAFQLHQQRRPQDSAADAIQGDEPRSAYQSGLEIAAVA